MRIGRVEFGAAEAAVRPRRVAFGDFIGRFLQLLPRPLRFLGVGGFGLITDLAIFTLLIAHGLAPLLARLVSLAVATLVTWQLNRAFTFSRSGRPASDEALRYAAVALFAQATSYAVFAAFVITLFARVPQLAVLIGAATGALVSYKGQVVFTFRPSSAAAVPQSSV
jgi:putative flippase GtrA